MSLALVFSTWLKLPAFVAQRWTQIDSANERSGYFSYGPRMDKVESLAHPTKLERRVREVEGDVWGCLWGV
jgi:hypothetical protein